MKHLIKMGWMLASAVMLCFTSCLNEASDPNSGEGELPGNVAALSEQVAAMKSSVSLIESLQATLAKTAELAEAAADFDACATAVNEHLASVEAGLSEVNASVAALKLQRQIAGATGSLKTQIALLEMGDVLELGVLSLEKGVAAWLGEDFKSYFEVSSEQARLARMLGVAEDQSLLAEAIASDVEVGLRVGDASDLDEIRSSVKNNSALLTKANEQMNALSTEVEQEYANAITSPTTETKNALQAVNTKAAAAVAETETTLADLASRLTACETALANLDARLEKVEADVAELLNMIQSLTFVSDFSEENAYAYYNMDVNTKVSDSNLPYYGKAQRTATGTMDLTYMVRPAAAAKALNANLNAVDVIGYYAKSIATKAPAASDYITLDITKVAVVNETRGMVTVTVTPNFREAFYYKEIGAKCALNVKSGKTDIVSNFVEILPKDNSTTVYATGVTPNRTSIELDKGESIDLSAVVYPSNAVQVCYWTSANNTIASFNGSTMTANEVGNTTVKVTTSAVDEWGLPLVAEIPVKVNEAIRLTGQRYVEVGYTAEMFLEYPTSAIVESKVWSTSDPSKLTVDQNGKVTGVAHTYNTDTKAYTDVTVSCTINGVTTVSWPMFVAATQPRELVTPALSDGQSQISMKVDESLSLASTFTPTENIPSGAYRITYQSDHGPGWINFDTGVINAAKNTIAPTTAWVTITVDNVNGENYYVREKVTRTVVVKVIPYYVKSITIDPVEIEIGQSVQLTPKLTSDTAGKNPTNTSLTWKSSNENIATVSQSGVVTSVSPGEVTITATAQDGSGVSGSCKVTITQPWKEFNVGDYVVRTSSGDIEFSDNLSTAQGKGTIVGIVITKTNPRATDPMLPASCTHGIAIGLGEGTGKWWSDSYHANATSVSSWAAQNGYTFITGEDIYSGYSNTLALKAYISAHSGLSSGIISAYTSYSGPALPNGTSTYYLPSAAEMKDVARLSNGSWNFSNKLKGITNGTGLQNQKYWTVSESSQSMGVAIKSLGLSLQEAISYPQKTSEYPFRYVFAF